MLSGLWDYLVTFSVLRFFVWLSFLFHYYESITCLIQENKLFLWIPRVRGKLRKPFFRECGKVFFIIWLQRYCIFLVSLYTLVENIVALSCVSFLCSFLMAYSQVKFIALCKFQHFIYSTIAFSFKQQLQKKLCMFNREDEFPCSDQIRRNRLFF